MKVFEYPDSKEEKHSEKIHGTEVIDNYRWLEELESEEVGKWVALQNKFTDNNIPVHLIDDFKKELEKLIDIYNEGPKGVFGTKEFYWKAEKGDNLATMMLKDLTTNQEEVLLDPHKWSEDQTDTFSVFASSPEGNYVVYDKVLGGDEWSSTLYIIDMNTKKHIDTPIPNTRLPFIAWKEEEGFFYTVYPDKNEVSEELAYNERNVYYHKLGTDVSEDILIYKNEDPQVFAFIKSTLDQKNCLITLQKGWSQADVMVYWSETGKAETIFKDIDALISGNIVDNHFIGWTNYLAPNGKIFKVEVSKPSVENWKTIVPEREYPLVEIEFFGQRIIAKYLEDSYHQLHIFDVEGTVLGKIKTPFIGTIRSFQGSWKRKDFQFSSSSFLKEYSNFEANIDTLETKPVFEPETDFNSEEYKTILEWYESKDGTKVPMFITMRKDAKLDSSNPILLCAYGGFGHSNVPYYYARNVLLLKQGFMLAYPSIRGGAEFGEKWHKAGMKENKQNVFDDFIAAAEWLIKNKYTQTKLLTIEGASNGGLLTGASVVQRPNLFGTVLIEVPVLDMVRFHRFYNAKPWMVEYGNPDIKEEFQYLFNYSPYHKAEQNSNYPAILLTTNINDKRVHPMHAFKMTAKLQNIEKHNPILLRTITKAGHGMVSRDQYITQSAEIIAFITWRLENS